MTELHARERTEWLMTAPTTELVRDTLHRWCPPDAADAAADAASTVPGSTPPEACGGDCHRMADAVMRTLAAGERLDGDQGAHADRHALVDIARAVYPRGHIPEGYDPAHVIMPSNIALVDRVSAMAMALATTGSALRISAEEMAADVNAIPREARRVHHVATGQQVGAAAVETAARAGMLIRLALHYLPAEDRPPNGSPGAAVWDYRVSAARELLKQMGANGA